MMGDGFKSYDHDHDNEQYEIAGCSVSSSSPRNKNISPQPPNIDRKSCEKNEELTICDL